MKPRTPEVPPPLKAWAARVAGGAEAIIALAGDGGNRVYYRLPGQGRLVLQGPNPEENLAWLRIGRHLWFRGFPLPRIYEADLERGFFLLEDLGDQSLAGPPDRSSFYPQAVEVLARFHHSALEGFNRAWAYQTRTYCRAMVEFQEVGYFLNTCLLNYLKLPRLPRGVRAEAGALARLAVASDSRAVLIHRDYQARNLLLKDGQVYILDWQSARLGPAAYDLASLLHETPFFPLSEAERSELTDYYLKLRGRAVKAREFRRSLAIVGAARMMQALGAYGHFSLSGKTRYADFMPGVLNSLRESFQSPYLAQFPILRELVAEAARIMEGSLKK